METNNYINQADSDTEAVIEALVKQMETNNYINQANSDTEAESYTEAVIKASTDPNGG